MTWCLTKMQEHEMINALQTFNIMIWGRKSSLNALIMPCWKRAVRMPSVVI